MHSTYENRQKHAFKKRNIFQNRFFWFIIIFSIFLFFIMPSKVFIFVPLIILHILLSWLRDNLNMKWIGIELILLNTVLAGVLLGIVGGIVMALLSVAINYIFSRKYTSYLLITLPIYVLIGIVSSFIPLQSLVLFGILITLLYNALSFVLSFTMGAKSIGLVIFTVTNIAFNILLFSRFGPMIIGIVG